MFSFYLTALFVLPCVVVWWHLTKVNVKHLILIKLPRSDEIVKVYYGSRVRNGFMSCIVL